MIPDANAFPYREITGEEYRYLETLIGTPDVDEGLLCDLFDEGSLVLRGNNEAVALFEDSMRQTLRDLDEESERAVNLYTGGALFYAAVFSHINDTKKLPIHEAGIAKLKSKSAHDLLTVGPETLRTMTGPFKGLLDRILPTFGGNSQLGVIANIGANNLNMAVVESKIYCPPTRFSQEMPELLLALQSDPEWAETRAHFDGFGT